MGQTLAAEVEGSGFRTSTCAGLSTVSMRRWRHPTSSDLWVGTSCAQRNSWMLPKKTSKLGFFNIHTAVRHHRLPPQLLPMRLRPQFPPQKDGLLASNFQASSMTGPPQAWFPEDSRGLQAPRVRARGKLYAREYAAGRGRTRRGTFLEGG